MCQMGSKEKIMTAYASTGMPMMPGPTINTEMWIWLLKCWLK